MTRWVGGDLWTRPPVQKGTAVAALTVALLGSFYVSQATTTKAPALVTLAIAGITTGAVVAMSRRDAVSLLTIVIVPLFLVPENYSIAGPLKSVGYPAVLASLACLVVWFVARWMGALRAQPVHPFRWAILAFFVTNLTAYAAALSRVLTQAEADSATRSIFPVLGMLGIAMLATDGLTNVGMVERLLKRLVILCTIQGFIGLLEFFLKIEWTALARLPGLAVNNEIGEQSRSGIERIAAAAAHSIEFSVTLAMAAPLALHFAMNAESTKQRRRMWMCLAVLLATLPLTVSRTGFVALAVGMLIYIPVVKGRARANLLVFAGAGLVVFPSLAPGVLGTIKGFFFAGTSDDSITGRLEDYAHVPGLMEGHWWFGRGFATFPPFVYFFLDNQYLMQLLTGGVIGLVGLVGVVIVGASVARGARKRFVRNKDRDLAQAVAGATLAVGITAGTFDLFSFLQCAFAMFLFAGCGAALWTIAYREQAERDNSATGPAAGPPICVAREPALSSTVPAGKEVAVVAVANGEQRATQRAP